MVGRDLDELYPKQDVEAGEVALQRAPADPRGRLHRRLLRRPARRDRRRWPAWSAPGAREVARAVFGVDRWDAGEVEVDGTALHPARPPPPWPPGSPSSPRTAAPAGPGDGHVHRAQHRPHRAPYDRAGAASCDRGAERGRALDWAVRLQLKYARLADTVDVLSGGNQQKVVLAKWLATEPDGADRRRADPRHRRRHQGRGAPAAVELAADGLAVLMISSDLPEVLGMADRVLVMHEGRLTAEIPRAEATEETVMAAATGRAAA